MPSTTSTYVYANGNVSSSGAGGGGYSGVVTGSNVTGNITISSSYGAPARPNADELPPLVFHSVDEAGRQVVMTLSPESGISTGELTKIVMLSLAMMASGSSVNALSYAKKHNLERHFTYS